MLTTMDLTLRHRRTCSRAEIAHVDVSSTTALAVYASTAQPSQSWIDSFTLSCTSPPTSLSKTTGSLAVFSPQGRLCAVTKDWTLPLGKGVEYKHSSSVMVRDVASGKTIIEIREAEGPMCWSRDGRLLAAGEMRDRVGIWDSKTGMRIGRVVSHIDTVTHAAFTSTDKLITLSRDGTLRITDPFTSKTLSRLEIDSSNPRMLSVSSTGSVVSIWGSCVHIWQPASNDVTSYALSSARTVEGWPLCISTDCRYLACRTEQGFDVMEVASGSVVCEREGGVMVTSGAFSPDSRVLLLGRSDGVLEVWDVDERVKN